MHFEKATYMNGIYRFLDKPPIRRIYDCDYFGIPTILNIWFLFYSNDHLKCMKRKKFWNVSIFNR